MSKDEETKVALQLNQWVQIALHASRNGVVSSGSQPIIGGIKEATLRVDCTTGNPAAPFTGFSPPFSDPAMELRLRTYFSWDGGLSFPEYVESPCFGRPTGIWSVDRLGRNNMAPWFSRQVVPEPEAPPANAVLGNPNAFKADLIVINGPIDFGLSLKVS